jgi:hypothetical protein
MCFVEVAVASAAVAEAPALRAHVCADEGVLSLTADPPELLFLVQFVAALPRLFLSLPFFWPSAPT